MKRTFTTKSILIITLIIAIAASLYESQPWKDARFRPSATRKYNRLWDMLRSEHSRVGNEDKFFYLAVGSRTTRFFSFGKGHWIFEGYRHRDCLPDRYDRTFGTLRPSGSRIILVAEFSTELMQTDLQIVEWGDRSYLLSNSEFDDFKKAIQSGVEPRSTIYGEFLLRHGDEQLPADGVPTLPKL